MPMPMDLRSPLFRHYPNLRGRIPFLPLGSFPTPVESPVEKPTEKIDGWPSSKVDLWVKRDDLSGPIYGGNKVRKLEFLLGEAKATSARSIATLGGLGSHHVLATALYGRAVGLSVEAVVFPQPLTDHVRQQLLGALASGCRLEVASNYLGVPGAVFQTRRRTDYWIPGGGSSPIGTLGYVAAALELREQVARGELPAPDRIYLPLGSCGTAAGLVLGLGLPAEVPTLQSLVVAVRVVDRIVSNRRRLDRLTRRTAHLLERYGVRPGELGRVTVDHRFFGGAYGSVTSAAARAIDEAAAAHLKLDLTYTGKAMAALLHDARAGQLTGSRVLFWNTFNSIDLGPLLAQAPKLHGLPFALRSFFTQSL